MSGSSGPENESLHVHYDIVQIKLKKIIVLIAA